MNDGSYQANGMPVLRHGKSIGFYRDVLMKRLMKGLYCVFAATQKGASLDRGIEMVRGLARK